jgi:four helix bundle protein
MKNKNVILQKSIDFALAIIDFCEELERQKKYVIARQLLRSGTSIGANIHEAQSSESRSDFIHKLKIAAKEASETEYWLTLCNKCKSYPSTESLFPQLISIQKLLSKIISTAQKNQAGN